ncbi:Membrane protein involved in the export of O-antigen and teichoic acid [Marivirga sericea]|uniref:Membrane protein involved in the export of O-antigen and teichoic acid n=1 Tax=Marivirga sericea TaxID=1028 RepID=A0A1X7I9F6_9BACT|nr:hypothetical protein [Marivirga sericea]SMG11281.1 Membrane protein involved in the export of O-antigen and teichoic acid [Marivirga sericea]
MRKLKNLLSNPKALLFGDQAVYSGTSFLLTLFIARNFSKEEFGTYSLWLIGVYFILNIISTLSIQQYQVLAPGFKEYKSYKSFNLFLLLALLILSVLIVFGAISPFLSDFERLQEFKLVIVIFGIGFLLHDFLRRFAIANDHIRTAFFMDVSYTFLVVLLSVAQYLFAFSFKNFMVLFPLVYFPAVVIGILQFRNESIETKHWKYFMSQHWQHGKWLVLSAMVQWWSSNLFVLASGLYLGIEALGAFRLVQSLFGLLNVFLQAIENYAIPTAARIYNEFSIPRTVDYLNKLSLKTVIAFGLVLAMLFLYATPLLVLAAGEGYENYGFVVKGMVILYGIIIIGYPIRIGIRILLLNKYNLTGYLFSLLISFVSFHFLLERFQLVGAIAGLICSQLILLSFWYYALRRQKFYIWKSYI